MNPVLTWHMYSWHDMSKFGICLFFYQIVIFILKYGHKQTQYSHCLKTSSSRNPRIFNIWIMIDLFCNYITPLKRWIAEWIKGYKVIVLVVTDHKSFWMRRFDSRQRLESSLFHYGQLLLKSIIRYFYTCTVLKLAIMIFVQFPSYLTNYFAKLCMSWLYSE